MSGRGAASAPAGRRLAGILFLFAAALAVLPARAQWPTTVTDVAGREVAIEAKPRRILLADGFQLLALALVTLDPVGPLVGWGGDLVSFDPATYDLVRER
ncbi:MAG TPA: hypothetical protein VFO41_11235, partial [Alphaproteobacteria bacterium]|nr:hypothetical protein [Alphaproteobacteria bacterium]